MMYESKVLSVQGLEDIKTWFGVFIIRKSSAEDGKNTLHLADFMNYDINMVPEIMDAIRKFSTKYPADVMHEKWFLSHVGLGLVRALYTTWRPDVIDPSESAGILTYGGLAIGVVHKGNLHINYVIQNWMDPENDIANFSGYTVLQIATDVELLSEAIAKRLMEALKNSEENYSKGGLQGFSVNSKGGVS